MLDEERVLQAAVLQHVQPSHGIHTYNPQGSHNCIQCFLLPLVWKNLMVHPRFPAKGWFGSALEVSAFLGSLQNLSTLLALEVVSGAAVSAVHEEEVVVGVEMGTSYFFQRTVIETACDIRVDFEDLQQHKYSSQYSWK